MSQLACKYHYDLPARWSCHSCQINLCTNCIQSKPQQTRPQCVICGGELSVVGAENVVVPFWQRLHHYFMYPFNTVPIGLILLLTVVIAALGQTLFGILAVVICTLIFMKYAYVVLEDTSHGYLLPRAFSSDMITNDLELPFKHILNIFLVIALNYMVYNFSQKQSLEYISQISVSLTLFFLPTSVMVLAVKHSFTSAFNPKLHLHIVKNIGVAYILLYVFVLMMLSSAAAAIYYVQPLIPDSFKLTVYAFISMYFLLCIFNMLGYVLYQYHEKIGFGIDVDVSSSQDVSDENGGFKLRNPAMVDVEILVQEGDYKKAMSQLENKIKSEPSDMLARGYYQRLLHLLGNTSGARKHCAEFVGRLLAEKKTSQAMKVFSACYKEDSEAMLTKASERFELASLYIGDSKYRLAMHLLNNLHKDHPSYSEIPQAYLLVAKMMTDQFNEDEKAADILRFVIENYPENNGVEEVKEYLKILESVTNAEALN